MLCVLSWFVVKRFFQRNPVPRVYIVYSGAYGRGAYGSGAYTGAYGPGAYGLRRIQERMVKGRMVWGVWSEAYTGACALGRML